MLSSKHILWSLGFRPFYLLAGLWAALLLPITVLGILGDIPAVQSIDPLAWHMHEMVFGYTTAVMCGFLFTAIPNWTGLETPKGLALQGIALLWILGRIGVLMDSHTYLWVFDILFLPTLALIVFNLLVRSGNTRNFPIVVVLGLLSLLNIGFHLSVLALIQVDVRSIIYVSLGVISVLISLISGRVIFAFTKNARPDLPVVKKELLDSLYFGGGIIFLLALLGLGTGTITSLAGLFIFIVGLFRAKGWQTLKVFDTPMLWILHGGYLWLLVSIFLVVISPYVEMDLTVNIVHSFSIGVIGSLTLGMMTRSALGHTGRQIKASRTTFAIFLLINLSVFVRVFPVLFWPDYYLTYVYLSASFWSLAFFIFALEYIPMLVKPRVLENQ